MIELNTLLLFLGFLVTSALSYMCFRESAILPEEQEKTNAILVGLLCVVFALMFLILYLIEVGIVIK